LGLKVRVGWQDEHGIRLVLLRAGQRKLTSPSLQSSGNWTTSSSPQATGEPSVGGSGGFFAKWSARRRLTDGALIGVVHALMAVSLKEIIL
jgi:hypothetical protein